MNIYNESLIQATRDFTYSRYLGMLKICRKEKLKTKYIQRQVEIHACEKYVHISFPNYKGITPVCATTYYEAIHLAKIRLITLEIFGKTIYTKREKQVSDLPEKYHNFCHLENIIIEVPLNKHLDEMLLFGMI